MNTESNGRTELHHPDEATTTTEHITPNICTIRHLTGREAIEHARATGRLLSKPGSRSRREEARHLITVEEAEDIAAEDPSLIWLSVLVDVREDDRGHVREARGEPESLRIPLEKIPELIEQLDSLHRPESLVANPRWVGELPPQDGAPRALVATVVAGEAGAPELLLEIIGRQARRRS